jgi:hypothetical protein
MPAPHSRRKGARKSRKGKAVQRQRTAPIESTAAATTAPAAPQPAAAAAPAAKAAPARQYAVPEYPYVTGELVRIGILAVILIAILVILSFVL